MKTPFQIWVSLLLMTVVFAACTTLNPNYEQPTVTLSSFKAIPSEGMVPAFEIGLRVINPNPASLNLRGIVYTVSLQGHELVKGVGKDFPVVEGYSEEVLILTASANLLAGIRFMGDLMGQTDQKLKYDFDAKLDMGGLFNAIRISESGEFDLRGLNETAP